MTGETMGNGQIAGVILAAGTSRRLRRPKQTLPLRGRPLLQHVVDAAVAADLSEVVVVLGHVAEQVEERVQMPRGVRTVHNPDYKTGQASSLRTGIEALGDGVDGAIVLLGDQPDVRPETIRALIEAVANGGGPIVQASYGERPGHPVLLGRKVWKEVAEITGDRGARDLIAEDPSRVTVVDVGGDPPADLDTWQDYEDLRDD